MLHRFRWSHCIEHMTMMKTNKPPPELHWSRFVLKLNKLRHLNLECCSGFNTDALIALAEHCDFLESFGVNNVIEYIPLTGQIKDAFGYFFTRRKDSLKRIGLHGLQRELIQYLPLCDNLEELEISQCGRR